jgi:heptosyltransferase-3
MMANAQPIKQFAPPRRILIIKLRHHGDMLLTTPVISTLKQHYPQAEIDMLVYLETRDMLASEPDLTHLFTIDRTWKKQGTFAHLGHESRLIKQLTARKYDLVVNLADQWRSALVTKLTGAPVRLGFDLPKRKGKLWQFCHTHLVDVSGHNQLHTVEQNLSILAPLNLPSVDNSVTMSYAPEDRARVEQILDEKRVTGDFVVIQPTSRWFFKCWTDEKMAETITALHGAGKTVVLTSGPAENELKMIDRILALSPQDGVVSLAGQLSLRQLAALIDKASLFIGVDSVPMHMAAALQTPLVALFGPSKRVFWSPWQANGEVIWAGDFCELPDPDDIDTHTSERYLDAIPAQTVIDAARKRLP